MLATNEPEEGRKRELEKVIKGFNNRIRERYQQSLTYQDGTRNCLEFRTLRLADDARDLLKDFDRWQVEQRHDGPLAGFDAFASKAPEIAARIAGVMTLFENHTESTVSAVRMQRAITLAKFYLQEHVRLAGETWADETLKRAEVLRAWLVRNRLGRGFNMKDLMNFAPRSVRPTRDAVEPLIQLLTEHGWIIEVTNAKVAGKGVRDFRRWKLSPIVNADSL